MRISDWSSDVCSSDLDVSADLGRVAGALCIGDTQPLLDRTEVIHVVHIHGEARLLHVVDPGTAAPAGRGLVDGQDRKGVVEGKGGAVRVDLGGRGIIKKKKKNKIVSK